MSIKISELTPKGANLQNSDLLEISESTADGYSSKSITGAEIITASQEGMQVGLVSGSNIKTINSTSLLGSGDLEVQPTLVSGTNIKTINGNSLLGSGDLVIGGGGLTIGTTAITSGTIGRILFEGTGNVLQESANLFWDNTNGRLGIGTSSPNTAITVTTNNVPTVEIISTGTTASTDFSVLRLQTTAKTWNIGTGGTTTGLNAVFYIDSPTSTATPFKILSNGTTNLLNTTINNLTSVTNFIVDNSNTSGYSVLNIKNSGASGKTYQIAVGGNTASSGFANNLYFADSVSGTRMTIYSSGNLGIGTTTDAGYKLDVNGTTRIQSKLSVGTPSATSAVMEVTSTTQGFLPPRMTTTQKNAIASPTAGLVVYDTTLNKLCVYTTAWETITSI